MAKYHIDLSIIVKCNMSGLMIIASFYMNLPAIAKCDISNDISIIQCSGT